MNILELDSYNLGDAVKFNNQLNPKIWSGQKMRPEVREKLMSIAKDFKEFLGLSDIEVKDVTVSGSNANYSYTPYSDIDLHLVVDIPRADADDVYRELFDAKKYQYNDLHNIKIGGYDVELYVENANKPPVSKGVYSIVNNDWINIPRKVRSEVDDDAVRSKYEDLKTRIDNAVAGKDFKTIEALAKKIKDYRQAGLDQHGELGSENLAYKMLRTQGKIKELYDARNQSRDAELSLAERQKVKTKPTFTWGFNNEDAGSSPDGVNPTTCMFLNEEEPKTDEEILKDFIDFCFKELKLEQMPHIKLRRDPQWPVVHKTFGRYIDDKKTLEVAFGQRHIMDVLRTVAHELTHKHQHERESVPNDAGETGSKYENEANARAGILMRDYGRLHPELFDNSEADLQEAPSQFVVPNEDPAHIKMLLHKIKNDKPLRPDERSALQQYLLAKKVYNTKQEVDEGIRNKTAAAALAACLAAGGTGCATTGDAVRTTRDVGRTAQSISKMTRPGVQAELDQELRNYLRGLRGDPGSQNQSQLYQLQKRMQTPESASGYIPTKKQARDPRFSMALTQDIKPGQVGKEANKLALRTDKQGHPQVARANGLFEKLALEFAKFKNTDEDYSPDAPPGPEFKPTMPKGTVKVDVSDVYDWYKLGQHISDMKGLGKHDFGKGPPASIISFGDEDTEHKFIDNLKKTGLGVTDIDPVDPKKRPGKKIKTDPTYNVSESIEQLDEVKMSPSALQQWANSDAARGIRAGFEAEMIFRDTNSGDDDDQDMEPDYDMDERCRSINQVVEFFQADDYGYGLSERQAAKLQEGLDEQYMEWMDEQMFSSWRDERDELIKEAWLREKPMAERVHAFLVDGMELSDEEADRIQSVGDQAPKFNSSKEQQAYAEENPDYATYLEATEGADDILQEDVEQTIEKEDGFYDEVLDEFRSDFYVDDDSSFFDDIGLRWMSDVSNSYDLGWPYLMGSGGNGGSRDWEEIGDSLHAAIDMPVKVSSNYHSATRREGMWIVEPDSSLQPDDREDFGLEIVSPPMPLEQALEKLEQVCDWANDPSEGNCYTNDSTGLHMGVSVPFKGGDVDYLKLILFLGDEYVLQSFGREANTYTKSAMSKFRENIKGGRADPAGAMKLMQSGLIELANREIQKGVGEGKYTSAHIQKGYIEFRSAGGDWLAEENADPEKLSSTMLRYARAMSLAANPAEERREYAKKLYKLIAPEGDSQLALFSQFAAGELTAEQLKKRWAEKTIGTEKKMNQRWRLYQNLDGRWEPVPGAEWNGYPESEVKNKIWAKYGREALDSGEYQLVNMGEQDWEVYDVNTGKTLEIVKGKSKGEVADAVYDKYVDQGIGFQVRPYEDPATLTPRAKLAKSIVSKPTGPQVYTYYKWNTSNPKNGENSTDYMTRERVFQATKQVEKENPKIGKYTNTIIGNGSAELRTSEELRDIDKMTFDFRIKGSNEVIEQKTYDRATDNVDGYSSPVVIAIERANALAKQLGKPVVAYEVTTKQEPEADTVDTYRGKWEFFYAPTGRVLDAVNDASIMQARAVLADTQRRYDDLPADQIQMRKAGTVQDVEPDVAQNFNQPQDATNRVGSWAIYDVTLGREISRMDNVAWSQADARADELERSTGHNMSVRGLSEAVDAVSGAGARAPIAAPKLKAQPPVKKVDPAVKIDVKKSQSDPYAQTYKKPVEENFADGKGPGRPGDSQRHGIPKGATIAQLEKAAKAPGRKGQLARWQLNMRRGKKK